MFLAVAVLSGLMGRDEDPMPTRADFIREVFDARPSPLTPKFHDAPKGYHVIKDDLLKGLVEEAEKRKLDLRGVVIAGPMSVDPLWTYTVVAFIREGDKIRVNLLVFPHARLTYKSTRLVTTERYEKWVAEMQGTGVLEPKPPAAAKDEKDEGKRDRMFTLLVSTSDPGGKDRRASYANPEKLGEEKQELFQNVLNSILKDQKKTYSVYNDDEDKDKN
jgi:hypothetical protein